MSARDGWATFTWHRLTQGHRLDGWFTDALGRLIGGACECGRRWSR